MSILNNSLLLGAEGAGGYQVARSLRFNSADSAYLTRTFATNGTSLTTCSLSLWIKRSTLGSVAQRLVDSYNGSSGSSTNLEIVSDQITVRFGGGSSALLTTAAVYRDVSAWYHIVVVFDSTQATPSNRIKLYVNGNEVTTFSSATYPSQNATSHWMYAGSQNRIGSEWTGGTAGFNGYLADIHFIDGQALTPSSFAETNATTGQWVPKAYTGTYGTNGFQLKFADNSAATATTLGKDTSGNGNNWTPNNLSVTAGAGNDSLVDTPTSYGTDTGAGGSVRGNYCTFNPLAAPSFNTVSDGGLFVSRTSAGASSGSTLGTFLLTSGKWYWEVFLNTNAGGAGSVGLGIVQANFNYSTGWVGDSSFNTGYWGDGVVYGHNTGAGTVPTYTVGDTIGIALDMDALTVKFYKNGASASGTITGVQSAVIPAICMYDPSAASFIANFGQRPFAYTAPSGFKALCDTNLPAPVVAKPNQHFDVVLRNGGAGSYTTTVNMSNGALLWDKPRNQASGHYLFDSLRGISKNLRTDSTQAEATDATWITSFNSNSFTTGSSDWGGGVSIVDWIWAAGSQVTNTQGSITSQVRANASAGFSIVTFTGTSANATVGHGLGVAPSLIIVKVRTDSSSNWQVYHASLGNTQYISLNLTNSAATAVQAWNNTSPTSSVFSVGTAGSINAGSVVAYCFAPVAGYTSMGSYVGNGSSDGVFVHTGFRVRWLMVKATSVGSWRIYDTSRSPYNVSTESLYANLSDSETTIYTGEYADLLSNGFKMRGNGSASNNNGTTYIYFAVAENPFQYARAR